MLFGMDWHLQLHTGVNWADISQIDIFTDTQCTPVGHWYYKQSGATERYWLCGILIMGGSVLSQLKPSGLSILSCEKTSTFFTAKNVCRAPWDLSYLSYQAIHCELTMLQKLLPRGLIGASSFWRW